MTCIGSKVYQLLEYGIKNNNEFLPNTTFASKLSEECQELFSRDYVCTAIDNSKGALCSTYPFQIILLLHEKQNDVLGEDYDKELFKKKVLQSSGRFARTRGRFPVPVLLFRNKAVCRSSTLARSPEIYSRSGYDYFVRGETSVKRDNDFTKHNAHSHASLNTLQTNCSDKDLVCYSNSTVSLPQSRLYKNETLKNKLMHKTQQTANTSEKNKEWLLDRVRKADVELLKILKVNVIFDLMVENKKVKFGVNVTSSEKVDSKNRYQDFKLVGIPYPGCEFFVDYMQNNYTGTGLQFNWNQTFVDAELQVCSDTFQVNGVNWNDYMKWDLVKITKNYLKLLLQSLVGKNFSGLLLHCISGWDRTPLFISILRLSLWADGVIHQSLSANEIVYLTLAYDWLLFGHQFYDRVYKSEEILHFCFEFLKDITSPEYSVLSGMTISEPLSSVLPTPEEKMCKMHNLAGHSETCSSAKTSHDSDQFSILTDNSKIQLPYQKDDITERLNAWQNGYLNESDGLQFNLDSSKSRSLGRNVNGVVDDRHQNYIKQSISATSKPATLPLTSDMNLSSDKISSGVSHMNSNNSFSKKQDETAASSTFQGRKLSDMTLIDEAMPSLETNTRSLAISKSEPITIVSDHRLVKETCEDRTNSFSTTDDESSASWQVVPPLAQDEELLVSDANYNYFKQNAKHESKPTPLSQNANVPRRQTTETELEVKLQRRKDRLESARNIMLPIYSAVVQKQRKKQSSTGLSGVLGTLVHFVKGT